MKSNILKTNPNQRIGRVPTTTARRMEEEACEGVEADGEATGSGGSRRACRRHCRYLLSYQIWCKGARCCRQWSAATDSPSTGFNRPPNTCRYIFIRSILPIDHPSAREGESTRVNACHPQQHDTCRAEGLDAATTGVACSPLILPYCRRDASLIHRLRWWIDRIQESITYTLSKMICKKKNT